MPDINPYESPASSNLGHSPELSREPTFGNVLASCVAALFSQWATLLAVLIVICLPWELLVAYVDSFIVTEDNPWPSLWMISLGPLTTILLAEGILIAATLNQLRGKPSGVTDAFWLGIQSFPRLFLWGIASGFIIGIGTVFCLLPGIYLNIRWMYVSAAVIFDGPRGVSPLDSSWDLTKRHLGFSTLVFLGLCIPMIVALMGSGAILEFFPEWQHWLLVAAVALLGDVVLLAVCCAFACAYHQLRQADVAPPQPDQWSFKA